ncbi:autotransporter outer membrane beta-barrel domain-containing protein [Bordetella bronchiseptica]|uniref:autotransporter outer membrane beta-barrel domain-containing protein n=1 Tax=Bordetella bronchiseptica TaxID=518 RepID=UPI000FDA0539|nr:autotransporter outer membrane beta-barrel domain-containing protein [Bordetella bronchiseptica]AZW29124.1 autotransporter outer membrane beta-barrel domain-containing protein [Bordetella bronchiseptica]
MQRRNQSFKRNIGQPGMRSHGVAPTVLVLALGFHGTAAWADCQTAGSAVTCDASSPNPYTGTVGSGASSGGLTITVGPDARIESGNAHAISVGTGNSISLDGNAQVSNAATTGGPGNYSTIEFEHSNTLTIGADARVAAEGTDPTAHAIALTGRSNTITNYGTVSSASGAAIWNQFEGIYVNNTVYNYGVIETAANGGDAVVIGSATGNNATEAGISLHNFAGARIVGNVVLSDTDDSVRLEAGSTLTGSLDGGTGTDTLYLEGATGSGELTGDVSNFNEISKIDSRSTWTLSGSLGANSSGKVTVVNAYNGELIVTGDNSAATAGSRMTVWSTARLQVNTTSAMAAIQSNGSGVAAFSQQTDGTYAGVLSGGGNFAKEGAGSLTLAGVNTYTGTLQLKEGKVIVSAVENLGAANSSLAFDGGTLSTTADMASARRATMAAGGGTFDVASGTTLNWTGQVVGGGTLVKDGAGTLALAGFNTHAGTVVNAGTVQISNDYGLGNGALTLNNSRLASTADIYTEAAATVNGNGTFDTANGTTLQWMGDIGGAGALVKTGAGTLLLGGDNLYAGGTVVNAGTVQVFKGASLGGGALTLNNARLASLNSFATANSATLAGNGTFDTATGTTLGWAGDIGGAGTLVKTGQGTLVLGGTNQYGGGTTVNAGTVQVARDENLGAAAGAVALNNARLASTGTFSTARTATLTGNGTFDTADGTTLGWTGDIGGAGALVKTGLGTLVLGGNNQYAGNTAINAGTVQVSRDENLGAGAGTLTLNGGTLAASAGFTSARAVTIGAGNGAMSVATGENLDWQGLIGGTGALIKEGAGTLVLDADNQYAAGTVVNAGTVQVARDENLGAAVGTLTLNGGALAASAGFTSARGVTIGAGNGAMSVATGENLDWQGLIGGTGALIKEGAGTLVLGNDNQYAAGTVVNAGTVQVARDANLGAAAGTVALNDARLASTGTFSTARAATLTGNGTFDTADGTTLGWTGDIGGAGALVKEGLGTLVLDGTNQYGGGTTVNAGTVQVARDENLGAAAGAVALNNARLASTGTFSTARTATLTGNGTFDTADGTTLDWAGDIGGAGALVKEGLGNLVLDGDNQYAGGTTVNAGTVQVARDANLGAAGGAVRLQGATLASTASFASARTLTLGAAGGTFATLGATTLGWDAAIDGAGGLTKTGAGDLVLSRANTYAGPTLIKEGRLAVNGSIASPVTIDPDGVLGGTGRILGAVANSGTVAPGNSIGTLTIVGNYAGTGGRLEMEAELGGDASPADRLVIDGGAATGSTSVAVINQGGLGGQTDQGIPLVVARNGATTTADAFSLASPVAAGAYEYKLLRGTPDGAAANAQNWYLRSGLLVPPAEVPGGGPGGAPEPEFIPFYRPEVALYAGAPMLMRAVGLQALGTYHERTGEQGLMTRDDPDPVRRGAWTRAFGRTFERSGSGDVDPRFDGHVAGLQAGVDLYARRSDKGHADLAGVFGGYANARGHMDGFARGETGAYAGKPDLNAYYIGGYWTHIGPSGWYVDAVLAGTRYEQKAKSSNDLRTEAKGWGVTASVEAGYPVPIGEKWHIEPQAQLVYQRLTVSNGEDDVSSVSYRTPDSVTARLGARLSGQYAYNTTQLRPFMEVSLLRDFAGTDTVTFSGIDRIDSRYQATAVDLKAGLVAQVRKDVGLWGQVGYGKSIGGGDGSDRGWAASLGLRIEY